MRKNWLKLKKKMRVRTAAVLVMAEVILALGSFTGCGNVTADVPELLEPVSSVNAYRPASKRLIGSITKYDGTVVARDYPVYAQKTITLSEIKVGVGDYVKKGDVIAISSVSDKSDQITTLQNEIASLSRERTKTKNISDATIKKLDYEKRIEQYLQNTELVNKKTMDILIEQENQRYNLAVIDNSISEKRSEIAELQEETANNTFTAPYSGRVTFVKDMTQTNTVNPFENIAVISDYNDLYIETKDTNIGHYNLSDYKSKWAYINNKKVDLVEHKYSNEEISYADSIKKYPDMSFDAPGATLTLGTDLVLFFLEEDDTPKLVVGKDSLNYENDEYFVYVKGEGDKNEKRIVEVGVSDEYYTEIKSGIEEGELIFYKNDALMPKNYDTAVASIGDYREELSTDIIDFAYPYYEIYTAEVGGTYKRLHDIGKATTGDALFSIESSVGRAELDTIKENISDLDQERTRANREYQYNKKDLETEIRGADRVDPDVLEPSTNTDADEQTVRDTMYKAEIKECELDILTYEETYESEEYAAQRAILSAEYTKKEKGTKKQDDRSDYVEYSVGPGQISAVQYSEDRAVEKDAFVMTEELQGNDAGRTKLLAMMGTSTGAVEMESAKLGSSIKLKNKKQSWTGTCIGLNGSKDKFYLFSDDGKPRITQSTPFNKAVVYQFYLEMDDELSETDIMQTELSFYSCDIRDVVVIPAASLKVEVAQLSGNEKYYVWKVIDGEIVKEYVDVYHPEAATKVKYILNGVEAGDTILK